MINLNKVRLVGRLKEDFVFSHETKGNLFYKNTLAISRNSGIEDLIPITVAKKSLSELPKAGTTIEVYGEYRSRNLNNKLILEVFVKQFFTSPELSNFNQIEITGFLCKNPTYRTTPFGRELCDLLVACNRGNGKSDYIPAIVWGRNAQFVKECAYCGNQVQIFGRIQSRKYSKKTDEGVFEERTAYEVSVGHISLIQ